MTTRRVANEKSVDKPTDTLPVFPASEAAQQALAPESVLLENALRSDVVYVRRRLDPY